MKNNLHNPFMPDLSMRPSGMVFKGGGGTTTVESIPSWYRPYVEKAATGALNAYQSGQLSNVAGLNAAQLQAINSLGTAAGRAEDTYRGAVDATGVLSDAAQGIGMYGAGATQGLKAAAIRDSRAAYAPVGAQLASSGQIGGARAGILANDRDAGLAAQLADIDYKDLADRRSLTTGTAQNIISNTGTMGQAGAAGANLLGEAGGMLQEQSQREMDAGYQGLQRLGGLLSGAPQPSQQAVSGGK